MGHLAVAASAAKAGGEILGGLSSYEAGKAQSQIAKDNAAVAARNAELTMAAGEQSAFNLGLKNRAQMGAITAGQGASGLDLASGSSKDVRDSQQALGLFDTMNVRSNAAREAFGYKVKESEFKNEAGMARARGRAALAGSVLSAAGSLAGGISDASRMNTKADDAGMAKLAF